MDEREVAERLEQVGEATYVSVDLLQRVAGDKAPDHGMVMSLAGEITAAIAADEARIEAGVALCKRLEQLPATAGRWVPTGF